MAGEIVLPLRLDTYKKAVPIINTVKTSRGGVISNVEFQGTDGAPVFAIEDGILSDDDFATDNNAPDLSNGSGRIWQYRHVKLLGGIGPSVKAGQKIGTADGNLILGVIDGESDSEELPAENGSRVEQLLGRNPLPLLDTLDVLPLAQDGGAAALTAEERHELSESITGKKGLTTAEMAILGGVGVVGLYGIYRLLK